MLFQDVNIPVRLIEQVFVRMFPLNYISRNIIQLKSRCYLSTTYYKIKSLHFVHRVYCIYVFLRIIRRNSDYFLMKPNQLVCNIL